MNFIIEGQKIRSIDVVEYLQLFYNILLFMSAWRQIKRFKEITLSYCTTKRQNQTEKLRGC